MIDGLLNFAAVLFLTFGVHAIGFTIVGLIMHFNGEFDR